MPKRYIQESLSCLSLPMYSRCPDAHLRSFLDLYKGTQLYRAPLRHVQDGVCEVRLRHQARGQGAGKCAGAQREHGVHKTVRKGGVKSTRTCLNAKH